VKQLRRIQVAPATNAWQRAARAALHHLTMIESEFLTFERERPGLVVTDGDSVLIGWPGSGAINLNYGFPDPGDFASRFPGMLAHLLPSIDALEAPIGVCLRLTERSARTFVEPAIVANAFELVREWWLMTLDEISVSNAPADALLPGFSLRPARIEDADAIAELDAASFAIASLTPSVAREQIAGAKVMRVLEDASTGRAIGYLQLGANAGRGYVSELVVHADYKRRGLGEWMMRWSFAWFRSQGLRGATLTVNTDNGPAIALYRKLGFEATDIGMDYRRPVDEEEARQVLEKRRGQYIKVRPR
jgi:[ribosomal protein S18]-alanine N-acetyltransferase